MNKKFILTDRRVIDKKSPIPYYHQLKTYMIEEINSGNLKSEQRLPSEAEFCRHFNISRTVVRQAFKELDVDGYLTTERGRGAFIHKPRILEGLVQKLVGFYEDMTSRGFKVTSDVLRQEKRPATEKIARMLDIKIKSPVIIMSRLRKINGEPITFVTTYLPADICPKLLNVDMRDKSLYSFLQQECGIKIQKARRYIGATSANENCARLLKIKKGVTIN